MLLGSELSHLPTKPEVWGRILVVDDDASTVELLSSVLGPHGSISCAATGNEAILLADSIRPDLLVLDLRLPDLHGLKLLKAIRMIASLVDVPVVVVSQYDDLKSQLRAFSAGATDFIPKPLNAAILLARVGRIMSTRARLTETRRISETRWQFALEGSNNSMWDWDTLSDDMTCSDALRILVELPAIPAHVSRESWRDRIYLPDRSAVATADARIKAAEVSATENEYRIVQNNGKLRWLRERCRILQHGSSGARRVMAVIEDTTERRNSERLFASLSTFDPLTGLADRARCLERLSEEIEKAPVRGQHVGIFRVNLGGIALLNHERGRAAGDELVRLAAERLQGLAGAGDRVFRFLGNEFAFIASMPEENASQEEFYEWGQGHLNHVIVELCSPLNVFGESRRCLAHGGLAGVFEEVEGPEDLIRLAELALVGARRDGTNAVAFRREMLRKMEERAQLLNDLKRGILSGEVYLAYQPIVTRDGTVVGAEALARWQHPTRGLVSPLDFIPLAEETGLIVPLGARLRRLACAQLCEWATRRETSQLVLSVNVSSVEFDAESFVRDLASLVETTGVDASRLVLEVTESLLLGSFERVSRCMSQIEELGIGFALDDFGTGYSSFSYLKTLPFQRVKVDRSFVRDILANSVDASLCRAIIAMGQNLGLDVVAEGVEEDSQVQLLADMGCTKFQGYLFGKPGDSEAILRLATQNHGPTSMHSLRARTEPPPSPEKLDASILVVDDDASTLHLVGRILKNYREVRVTTNPLEALDLVKEAPPHLLVLDALMPQMNGFELLDAIQAIPGCEEIPAVFITALLDPDVEVRALSRGAADFVTKPISSARLSISVRNQLGLKRATDALRVQASLDPLTSIANRRSFDRALTRETERAAATDTSLSLLMVDIDHFKSINDTFGHPAGDLCITGVATALVAEASRKMDLVARYGGEEFAVILPASDSDYAAHVAERIVRRVARSSFEPVGDAGTVTVSVGWASSYPAGDGLSERTALLETADRALFRAKSTGRNRACGLLDLSPPPSRPPRGPNR